MNVKIVSKDMSYQSEMTPVLLNEMLSLLTQMPGKYDIVIECNNEGKLIDPNRIVNRNFKSSFVEINIPTKDLKQSSEPEPKRRV